MINDTIFAECPRYNTCSVNNCPLSRIYPNLIVCDDDKESVCNMEKQVRFRIGSKYPELLKYQGLTVREWAAKKKYESMTNEEKELLAERGKKALLSNRMKKEVL